MEEVEKFVDCEFPPVNKSLYRADEDTLNLTNMALKCYTRHWLRPEQIHFAKSDKNYDLSLLSSPAPSDILQG